MFEAVIALCISLSDGPCRDHLLPGYEATTQAECITSLEARPPDLKVFEGLAVQSDPNCTEAGETLRVVEIAPGVFVHMGAVEEPDHSNRGDVTNLGFIVGDTSVAVIDTGTARWMGEALWRSIRQRTDKPATHVVLTHMHPDHVLGAGPFVEAGAKVIGHKNLSRALSDRQANYLESLTRLVGAADMLGTRAVPVDIAVEEQFEIDLGNRKLVFRAWPMAHTGSDLTVLDQQTKTLFAGDLVFDRHTPALDGRLRGWRAVLSEMESIELARVVPGHGGPSLEWPLGAAPMTRYLEVLETDTRTAIEAGQRLGEAVKVIGRSEKSLWALFQAYNPRNATVAFTELEWE
ncbi:quinoprotein relay system zinc metallohydrolase 2 [Roseobacter sp.]|uniref:quinoprotein relay system zinc metallohydrolase 2 n=1 Tax=Roseobacter sp. TaxID=1907202 RepID=UPI00385CEB39